MRCEYRFRVLGTLRLDRTHPIIVGDHVYRFHLTGDTQRVEAITVEVPANDPVEWPRVRELPPEPGNPEAPRLDVTVSSPAWSTIQDELRTIEGLLAFYGLESIDTLGSEIRFIPESEAERARLDMYAVAMEVQPRPDTDFEITPFDLVARSVLSAPEVLGLQVALSFFRKGRLDMHAERFIDAFYDFFFVLETLFAEGRSRTRDVQEAFERSSTLLDATAETMRAPDLAARVYENPAASARLKAKYETTSPPQILRSLVETRGFLHHHSGKNPRAWDPDRYEEYQIDATIIQEIAYKVLFKLTNEAIFSPRAVEQYQKLFAGVMPRSTR